MTNIMMKMEKQVKLDPETHAELVKIGRYGETMDDIVNRCLKAYHEKYGKSRKGGDTED